MDEACWVPSVAAAFGLAEELRQGYGAENANDHHNDQQFDQREAVRRFC